MKILIITGSLPYPPASGGALRAYGIIKGLHDSGHKVTLMSFHDHDEPLPPDHPLCALTDNIVLVAAPQPRSKLTRIRDLVFSSQPDIARRLYTDTFAQRLKALLAQESFDLIQVEGIEVACYLPTAHGSQPQSKLCFDTFNAEYLLQRNIAEIDRQHLKRLPAAIYSYIQARRIQHFEREMCQLADLVIAVSEEDAAALRDFRTDKKIYIISSGIFVDHYQSTGMARDDQLVVFTGKMDYRPNVDAMTWFYEAIFPQIAAHIPDICLTIVGQKPHPRLDVMRQDPHVTITGWVDSVQPYLDQAGVYIAPLRMGSGTRLKLLEAMASKCAIVATPMAAAGLNDTIKTAMIIANDEKTFADAVINLLQDPSRRTLLGQQAYAQVKAHYDWEVLTPRILQAYKEVGLG